MGYTARPTSIRLTEDDVARIHRLASKQGIGQATVIRLALRLGLAELEELLSDRRTIANRTVRGLLGELRQRDSGQTKEGLDQ
jgi:predicted DNA-binding protein